MAKKMTREEEVYEELRKVINESPLRAPRTPSLMRVLKFFFPTIEDAEVGRYLPGGWGMGAPKTAAQIAEESGKDTSKVEKIPNRLATRGAVSRFEMPGQPEVVVYLHSGTWGMSDFLGTLGLDNSDGIKYREVMNSYYDEGYLMEWGSSKYPAFRTLVVDQSIDAESATLPYELASEVIKANETIAIGWCNCRVRHRNCNHRIDCCFLFGPTAEALIRLSQEIPGARPVSYVSQEEALKCLEECFKEGLVASTMNNADPTQAMWICMCCTCCCHILGGYARNITGWGNPYQTMKSNFQPRRDEAKCLKCKTCIELCPVNALWRHYPHQSDLSDDFIFFEEDRCLGCGICAFNCPSDALTMEKVRELTPEPDTISQWARMRREARH